MDRHPRESGTGGRRDGVAAGVVLFGPDSGRLNALLDTVEPSVGRTFAFVNGRIDPDLAEALRARAPRLVLIEAPVNFGIATALNLLVAAASLAGFGRIVLFDQDSRPPSDLVPRLGAAMDDLLAGGERPAVVGPLMVSPREGPAYKSPRVFVRNGWAVRGSRVAVDILATSGSMIDIPAWRAVGKFRDDYFIDAVDLEWCFRAWSCGFSCWIARDVEMVHTVGEGAIRAGRLTMPRQKLFRMGTYLRNNIYGLRLAHVPLGFKLRQAAYLPAQALMFWRDAGFSMSVAGTLARAAADGLRGRLGPPPDAPLT